MVVKSSHALIYFCSTVLFCLLWCWQPLSANPPQSDEKQPLHEALRELHAEFGIHFVYADDLVDDIMVTRSKKRASWHDTLEGLLKDSALTFERVSTQQIAIIHRPITGTILDLRTDDPLLSANVVFAGTNTGVMTTVSGGFRLTRPSRSHQELMIRYIGYYTEQVSIEEWRNPPSNLTIQLRPRVLSTIDEIIVVGSSTVRAYIARAVVLYHGDDLDAADAELEAALKINGKLPKA